MRFTTWSTLTNTFIIATVAPLSLVQVAKATPELIITAPNRNDYLLHPMSVITIQWCVPNRAGSQGQDKSLMAGISGNSPTLLNYLEAIGRPYT
jgi:hypothetical protein